MNTSKGIRHGAVKITPAPIRMTLKSGRHKLDTILVIDTKGKITKRAALTPALTATKRENRIVAT